MFRNWGFLLTEIWVLLLLAALLGLLVGWLIWARRAASCMVDLKAQRYAFKEKQARIASLEEELRRTKAGETGQLALDEVKIAAVDQSIENKGRETRSAEVLASELAALKASAVISERDLATCKSQSVKKDARIAELEAELRNSAAVASVPPAQSGQDFDGDGVVEGTSEGTKPNTLEGPREGGADDLKQIKGVGPKLEGLLHSLGFYHFDQVAAWGAQEVAWVDANLEGFTGRVSRDEWVPQDKILARGGSTAFSKKVDKGDVY